jgi:hypothetical protein
MMRIIKGYEGEYVVYDCGCVLSFKHNKTKPYRILKQDTFNGGYKRVTLSVGNKQKRVSVHRLVAEYFLPVISGKRFVNHKDGDKTNNHVSNLEWCTSSENERHSYSVLGKVNPQRKLSPDLVEYIRSNAVPGNCRLGGGRKSGNIKTIADKCGISINTVHNILKGKYYASA